MVDAQRPGREGEISGAVRDGRGRPRVVATFEGRMFLGLASLFALAAVGFGENVVFLLGCLTLGAALAARVPAARNLCGVGLRARAPARAHVGRPVRLRWEVTGPARGAAVGVTLRSEARDGRRPVALTVEVGAVAAGQAVPVTPPLLFTRRGWHPLGEVEVSSRYPFGLYEASARVPLAGRVLVRPFLGHPTAALRERLAGRSAAQARPSLRHRGGEAFHGVREFRDGDDPRRIHWRTTARRGALTLTQWRREEARRFVLVLGRGTGAGVAGTRAFERAVACAATVWATARRAGLRATLELGTGRGGPEATGRGLDVLAVVRAQGGRRPRAALRALALERAPRTVIYVAAGDEPGIGRRLQDAAGPGGDALLVRADLATADRWVKGLPWAPAR